MNGSLPFNHFSSEQITELKSTAPSHGVISAYSVLVDGVKSTTQLNYDEEIIITKLLLQTMSPNPGHRFDLRSIEEVYGAVCYCNLEWVAEQTQKVSTIDGI
jgi:hypothetical protein